MNQTPNNLNALIGIPFKIAREDFKACDCVGICWLYHKHIHSKDYKHRDGKMLVIRDPRKDVFRILDVMKEIAHQVKFEEIQEGDILIMMGNKQIGALGVAINATQMLHMDKNVGSRISKIANFKENFLRGYRFNE